VTAVVQQPNNNAPNFVVSRSTVAVAEDISRGSAVPGVNIEVSDPDVRKYCLFLTLSTHDST